jgi:hypothetical protein
MHGLRISQVLIGFVKMPVNKICIVERLSIFSTVQSETDLSFNFTRSSMKCENKLLINCFQ